MGLTRPKYSQIYDTDWKQSVEVASTGDVGNLVAGNTQPSSVDGVSVSVGNRILVKDQSSGAQNGIYTVRSVGTGSNGWWTRSLDSNQSSFVTAGLTVSVVSGNTSGGREYKLTTPDPITLDVTPLTFINPFATTAPAGANTQVQFNDASTTNATAGFTFNKFTNAVSISGNVSASLVLAGNVNATGNIISTGAVLNLLTVNGNATLGVAGQVSGSWVNVVGNITQTTAGGAVYFNTTGNVLASALTAGTSTVGGLTLTGGALYRNGGETQILGGGGQTTRAMIRLGNSQGLVLYGSGTAAAPGVQNTGIIVHGGDGNIQLRAPNTASGGSRIQLQAELVETQGNLTPVGNLAYSVGNATNQWNTIYANNVNSGYFTGSGALLTVLPGYAYSNVNIKAYTESMGFQNYGNVNVIAYLGAGNVTVGGNLTVGGNVYSNSGTDPLGYVYSIDDLSSQFDGRQLSFTITVNDGTVYSVKNPNQISLQIGGVPVAPTRYIRDYFNLTEVSLFNRGFYLQTGNVAANTSIITGNNFSTGGNTIVFATAPTAGMSFYGTVRTNSDPVPAFTFKQSPFTALNIMLGP